MNVFGDADAAAKLTQPKQQIAGLTGQDLAQRPGVTERVSRASQALKNHVLIPGNVSQLTERLKRRVVLGRCVWVSCSAPPGQPAGVFFVGGAIRWRRAMVYAMRVAGRSGDIRPLRCVGAVHFTSKITGAGR